MSQTPQLESTTVQYNLLEEDWIPVLLIDGTYLRMNPIRCLEEATRIKSIAVPSPMDRFSILRFLLALLCSCRVHERIYDLKIDQWIDLTDCKDQLKKESKYFNLFGDSPRFYQWIPPDSTKKEYLSTAYLIHEIPAGINVPFFIKARDGIDGLCPRCCAMGLLRLPLFTTMGGRGKKPSINGKPPVYLAAVGESLSQTLMLSMKTINAMNLALGEPSWRSPIPRIEGNVVPLLKGLTWLPRAVWLDEPLPEQSAQAQACIYCGSKAPLVRRMIYKGIKWAENLEWKDPHVLQDNDRQLVLPDESKIKRIRYKARSGTVAILLALLKNPNLGQTLKVISEGRDVDLWAVALASDQNKYIEAVEHTIPLSGILTEHPDTLIEQLDRELSLFAKVEKKTALVRQKPLEGKGKSRAALLSQAILNHFYPHLERSRIQGILRGSPAEPISRELQSQEHTAIPRIISLCMLPNAITALRKAKLLESPFVFDKSTKKKEVKHEHD